MTHELKTWPRYFEAVLHGEKTFEVRRDDRGFQKGDELHLREYNPEQRHLGSLAYTGKSIYADVTFVMHGMGIAPGYCCMAIKVKVISNDAR